MAYHDVTVLGAGWAGIVSTKYMLEEGLTVVTLERRDDLGGLWYYSDDPAEKTTISQRTRRLQQRLPSSLIIQCLMK